MTGSKVVSGAVQGTAPEQGGINPRTSSLANSQITDNEKVKLTVSEESARAAQDKVRAGTASDATEQANKEEASKAASEVRLRREAELAANDQAERSRIDALQRGDDPNPNPQKENAELARMASQESDRIMRADRDGNDPLVRETPLTPREKGSNAAEKLRTIALAYPRTTPDEHTIFGFGGHKYTLGDLRDLVNIR